MSWCSPPVRCVYPAAARHGAAARFCFRTLADVAAILAIDGPAVVIGGGVLGVEAAAALRRHGDNVTLLHRGDRLMEQQTDALPASSCSSSWRREAFAA
jgi:NAD(P)H-nitrite reductase large subunit